MPSYENHTDSAITWAAVAGTTSGPPVLLATASLEWTAITMCLTFLSGYLGGVLPDTDSYSSIPRRWLNRTIVLVLDLFIVLVIFTNWRLLTLGLDPRSILLLTITLALGAMSGKVDDAVQRLMPTHREELHDLHVWIVLGAVFGIALSLLVDGLIGKSASVVFGAVVAAGLIGGVFTHLILDQELPGEPAEHGDG